MDFDTLSRHFLVFYVNFISIFDRPEFSYIGDSVIASWGYTKEVDGAEGPDGTDGNQPRGTRIVANIVRENGHFSKQASPYFQAKTAQTTITHNIFFNGPRAGINFNDVRG